jgi:hypothetical protein
VVNESGDVDVTKLHRCCKQISTSTPVTNVAAAILKIAMKLLRI